MKREMMLGTASIVLAVLIFIGCSGSKKNIQPVQQSVVEKSEEKSTVVQEEKEEAPVPAKETVEVKINLMDINFDFDKYDLRSDALAILAEHVKKLKNKSQFNLIIEGHCDELGTVEYNLALGERRAAAVRNYFIKSGISSDKITIISFGKEKPLDPRSTKEAWAKNRRATFVLNTGSKS